MRSGLDGAAAAAGPVLEGRAGWEDGPPPKKSNPNKESPARVCLGGTASAFGGTARAAAGGPVLGRGGAGGSSPNKSIAGCGLGSACGARDG